MKTIHYDIKVETMNGDDIEDVANYWHSSTDEHLVSMGVDLDKIPEKVAMINYLNTQLSLPLNEKSSYAMIWHMADVKIGHCNVNQITFGESAQMHFHIWDHSIRKQGLGEKLVKKSLRTFFEDLKLKDLFCEPYALNDAPNRTLKKVGFTFVKKYTTIPGSINFEQEVNQWKITNEQINALKIS